MTLPMTTDVVDTMYKGTEYTLKVTVKDDTGAVYNLTGATVKLRLAHSYTDTVSILEKTGSIVDAALGRVNFNFVPADTSGLSAKTYDISITVTSPSANPWIALQGRFGLYAFNPGV